MSLIADIHPRWVVDPEHGLAQLRQSRGEQRATSIEPERAARIGLSMAACIFLGQLAFADPGLTVKNNDRIPGRIAQAGANLFKQLLPVDEWSIP